MDAKLVVRGVVVSDGVVVAGRGEIDSKGVVRGSVVCDSVVAAG